VTRRGAALAAAAALATVAAGSVVAAPSKDALVRPGLSIGKVRLGMDVAQVRRAMGRHDSGVAELKGFGSRRLELTWWSGLADHFIVELLGPRGRERVVSIATSRKSERTGAGIGPGVRVARLMRVYPRARCRSLYPVGGGSIIGSEFVIDAGSRDRLRPRQMGRVDRTAGPARARCPKCRRGDRAHTRGATTCGRRTLLTPARWL